MQEAARGLEDRSSWRHFEVPRRGCAAIKSSEVAERSLANRVSARDLRALPLGAHCVDRESVVGIEVGRTGWVTKTSKEPPGVAVKAGSPKSRAVGGAMRRRSVDCQPPGREMQGIARKGTWSRAAVSCSRRPMSRFLSGERAR